MGTDDSPGADEGSMKGLSRKERLALKREQRVRRESQRIEAEAKVRAEETLRKQLLEGLASRGYEDEDAAELSLSELAEHAAGKSASLRRLGIANDVTAEGEKSSKEGSVRSSTRRRSRQTRQEAASTESTATEPTPVRAEAASTAKATLLTSETASVERSSPSPANLECGSPSPANSSAESSGRSTAPPTDLQNIVQDPVRATGTTTTSTTTANSAIPVVAKVQATEAAMSAKDSHETETDDDEQSMYAPPTCVSGIDQLSMYVNVPEEEFADESGRGNRESPSGARPVVSGAKRIESPVRLKKKQLLTCAIYGETPPPEIKIQPVRSGNKAGGGPPRVARKRNPPAEESHFHGQQQRSGQHRYKQPSQYDDDARDSDFEVYAPDRSPHARQHPQRENQRKGSGCSNEPDNASLAPIVGSFASSPEIPLLEVPKFYEADSISEAGSLKVYTSIKHIPTVPSSPRRKNQGYDARTQRARPQSVEHQNVSITARGGGYRQARSPQSLQRDSPGSPTSPHQRFGPSKIPEHEILRRPRARGRGRPKSHIKPGARKHSQAAGKAQDVVPRSFTPAEAVKTSKRFRTKVDSLLGRARLQAAGNAKTLPAQTMIQVSAQDLADASALLHVLEEETRRLTQTANRRAKADRVALIAIQDLVHEVGAEVEEALPEMATTATQQARLGLGTDPGLRSASPDTPDSAAHGQELRSTSQAHLWVQQARAVKEILAREVGQQQQAVFVDNASVAAVCDAASIVGDDSSAGGSFEPAADILPNVAVQALEVACGLTRTFQQACQEGLESADKIIRDLYARQELQTDAAGNAAAPGTS